MSMPMDFLDTVLSEDLDELAANPGLSLDGLYGKTVLVTGASGSFGSILVRMLLRLNRNRRAGATVIAAGRDLDKLKRVFPGDEPGLRFLPSDVTAPIAAEGPIDFIFHCASVTASKEMVTRPVETIATTVQGTANVLALAREKGSAGVVFLSTMEVYGVRDDTAGKTAEPDLGYLDLGKLRSSYPESKRLAELLCLSYAREYGVPVRVARLAQVIGSGFDYADTRAPAMFARCAVEGRDIVLNTDGSTRRNCIYTRDALRALLFILLKGESGEAYNVADGRESLSILETARMVAERVAANRIAVRVVIDDPTRFPDAVAYRLSTEKLEALGWRAEIDAAQGYARMAESFRLRRPKPVP